jgi:hypothetical protein
MKTDPIALRPVPATQFQGVVDVASNIVHKIDSNKVVELLTTDVAGMVVPRTYLEYRKRGPDIGRETFIREICGTIFNLFLIGWLGSAGLKMMNNRSGLFNSLGLHTGAWVNAKSLDAFGTIFEKAVNEAKTPQEARAKFVQTVLSRIEATDGFNEAVRDKLLQQVDSSIQLRGDKSQVGRLTKAGQKALEQMFNPTLDPASVRGTFHYEGALANLAEKLQGEGRFSEAELRKILRQERLNLSQHILNSPREKAFLDTLTDRAIKEYGLSGNVHLMSEDGKTVLLQNRNLSTIFKELKHFLEHYADRALVDAKGEISNVAMDEAKRGTILTKLMGQKPVGFLEHLKRFIPCVQNKLPGELGASVGEGLLPYAYKSRWFLTFVPFVTTVALSISVSFINNWWTSRKYGGAVFFPGEGVPPANASPNGMPGLNNPPHPRSQLARSGGAFDVFQRQMAGGNA